MNPSPAVLISNVPGNVRDFFSLGWEEMKFKTHATLSRQGLNSGILMLLKTWGFLFLYFSVPQGMSILQTTRRGKRKIFISQLCIVIGQSKCWVLVL